MKRQILISSLILLFVTAFAIADDLPYKQGELLVRFADVEPGVQLSGGPTIIGPLERKAIRNTISNFAVAGAYVHKEYDRIVPGLTLVKLPEGVSVLNAVVQFNKMANVLYAEPNYKIRLCQLFPNDPNFPQQWGLHNTGQTGGFYDADIDAPEAWELRPAGAPSIIVAVTDTGIDYNHPDLNANMWVNTAEVNGTAGVDDDGNGYIDDIYGYDFMDNDGDPLDEHYHGTHVAGTIGAVTDNNEGVAGVCWYVQLMALKIFDPAGDGEGWIDAAIEAIDYAILMGADVINASWRTYNYSQGLYDAIQRAEANDVLFVAAAGNENINNDGTLSAYPASFDLDNIISVMSTDHYDDRSGFSNYGATTVDLGAPGSNIISTFPTYETDAMADAGYSTDYETISGTSMAAPHVSGACALVKEVNPNLTYEIIKAIILYSVDPRLPGLCVSGGRLNLHNALVMAKPGRVLNATQNTWHVTIQDALDTAYDRDEIIAEAGRWYFESIDFNGVNVLLRSGDVDNPNDPCVSPMTTYISGFIDVNSPVVTIDSGEDANAVLLGFTILDGNVGIFIEQSSPVIDDCRIRLNRTDASGAGIYCGDGSEPNITSCEITDNIADVNGGGIYCANSLPNITNCDIRYNKADTGGGIYCGDGSEPKITDCNIHYNIAYEDGSGIYCDNSSPRIDDCWFYLNDTYGNGGHIYCTNDSDPNISNCTLEDSWALEGSGAGMYLTNGSDPNIINCTITGGNWARDGQGGAIYCGNNSNPNIKNCIIEGNRARWEGGGIYLYDSSPTITECQITDNNSNWDGGGIYCDSGSEPNISNSTIISNIANYDGGGVYLNGSSPLIKNCLIVNNTVESWDGGGILCWDGSPAITNCTFARNSGNESDGLGGALYCLGTSKPVITNCIFSNNKDVAIYEYELDSDPNVRFCLFYDNPDGDYYDKDSGAVHNLDRTDPTNFLATMRHYDISDFSDSNNIGGNPMFVRGRLGHYYLSQFEAGQILDANGVPVDPDVNPEDATSPAVDAGSGDADDPNIAMHLYSTRTDNYADASGHKDLGRVDMGYHYIDPCAPVYFDLTINIIPTDSGVISFLDPNRNDIDCPPNFIVIGYTQYTQVPLAATPIDPCDYQFKSWQGTDNDARVDLDLSGGILEVQHNIVTMDANETVTVTFESVWVYLRTRVIGGGGTLTPRRGTYRRGTVVELTATPDNPSDVIVWDGTDDDSLISRYNTVTMAAPPPFLIDPQGREYKEVTVEFYVPRILYVPAEYPAIQAAIDDAHDGDIIELAATGSDQPYISSWGYEVVGKIITITSPNPDDPCCVANTVIEMQAGSGGSAGSGFYFANVGRNTILNGITLRRWSTRPVDGRDADEFDEELGIWDGAPGGSNYGGAISLSQASPTIKNCVIADCNISGSDGGAGRGGDEDHPNGGNGGWPGAAYGGAMACLSGSSPAVINCTFRNNTVTGGNGGNGGSGNDDPWGRGGRGGGYYYWYPVPSPWQWLGSDDDYTDPSKYSGRGGAVYVGPGSTLTFTDCTFINNRSIGGFNGICGENGTPPGLIDEPSINWRIDNLGGAVFCDSSTVKFVGCTFSGNVADTTTDPNNDDPYASYGGAVAFTDNANVSFEDCTFSDNEACVGGGMYWRRSDLLISDCNFVGNSAFHGGGVLFVGGTANIARSSFSGNEATGAIGQGGGICCLGAKANIVDCNIANNDANGSGGGIYISSKNIYSENQYTYSVLESSLFSPLGVAQGWKADDYSWSYNLPFSFPYFGSTYNSVYVCSNGFLDFTSSYSDYTNSTGELIANVRIAPLWDDLRTDRNPGDDIYIDESVPGQVMIRWQGTTYANNEPVNFAVVLFDDGNIRFDYDGGNITLTPTVGISAGNGANYTLVPGYDGVSNLTDVNSVLFSPASVVPGVLVKNCLVTNNLANRDGGGISADWHADVNIVYCTIADNMVTGAGFEAGYGGGLYCSYSSYTNVINSILWGNSGQNGPQLAIGTGFEHDPLPSTVDVSYSDVQGAQSYVFIDEDCTLNWGAGNIHADPFFVTGPLGDYYLSQIAAGQPVDSDCVDAGSKSAKNLGMNRYTTRTDEQPDRKTVDMGYHHPFTAEAEPCRFCELFRDGIINFKDFAVFVLNWLSEGCNPANDWCQHADITLDTYVDLEDVELFAECWLVEDDTHPPLPNPSEWAVEPYASSLTAPYTISMTAETASDAWDFWVGQVQYYFDCVYGDCNDSGWQDDPNYTGSNLVTGAEYGYRVRARDASKQIPDDGTGEPGNKTGWSPIRYATAGEEPPDDNPPTPNPMTWAVPSYTATQDSITLFATTAVDDTAGVEYYFEDFNSPGVNSGWIDVPEWTDVNLTPDTTYTYRVRARDTSPGQNETGWSPLLDANTLAEPLDTNPPAPVEWEVAPYETGSGLNAYANMTAVEAIDPEGNGVLYYFECVDIPSINSGWTTERVWNNVPIGRENQFLYFHFRVSDELGNISDWSTSLPCY